MIGWILIALGTLPPLLWLMYSPAWLVALAICRPRWVLPAGAGLMLAHLAPGPLGAVWFSGLAVAEVWRTTRGVHG